MTPSKDSSYTQRLKAQSMRSLKTIALAPLYLYRYCISPLMPPTCRFIPTCSSYAHEAVQRHGAVRGGWLALKRVLRCHPFSKKSAYDPVPDVKEQPNQAAQTMGKDEVISDDGMREENSLSRDKIFPSRSKDFGGQCTSCGSASNQHLHKNGKAVKQ